MARHQPIYSRTLIKIGGGLLFFCKEILCSFKNHISRLSTYVYFMRHNFSTYMRMNLSSDNGKVSAWYLELAAIAAGCSWLPRWTFVLKIGSTSYNESNCAAPPVQGESSHMGILKHTKNSFLKSIQYEWMTSTSNTCRTRVRTLNVFFIAATILHFHIFRA